MNNILTNIKINHPLRYSLVLFLIFVRMMSYGQIVVNNDCSNVTNPTTVDLTKHVTDAHPAGTSLTWHTGTPATSSNKFTGDPTKAPASTAGNDYYAAYEDAASGSPCYSPTSTAIRAVLISCTAIPLSNACPTNFVDLTTHVTSTGTNMVWIKGLPLNIANKVSIPAQVGVSGDYYAVFYDATNNCFGPASAPVVVTITHCNVVTLTNVCPSTFVDLTPHASPLLSSGGAQLKWFTSSTPSAATMVADPSKVGTTGSYYAAYYDSINNCFSPVSAAVQVTITTCGTVSLVNVCPSNKVDLTSHASPLTSTGNAPLKWFTSNTPSVSTMVTDPAAVTTTGTYYPAYYDQINNCFSPTGAGVAVTITPCTVLNPDFAVVQPNTPSSGNVSTNDSNVPAGTTYGQPVPVAGNPSPCVPVMASNGSYTFTCTTPGDYNFNVPVCPPGVTVNCPTVPLKITVSDPLTPSTNSPIVNPDFASTQTGAPVTVKTLANDVSGNPAIPLNPASVSIVTSPKNGTAVVDSPNGDIIYTPSPGFVGSDTLKYQVCDTATPPKCGTAQQIFTVLPTNAPNTTVAVDDYVVTRKDTPVSGSVKTNDSDPQGNTQTITAGTTNVPGAGSLVLNSDGSYVFTPVSDFVGTVAIPYTTCDNGTPQACATATLNINVMPPVCSKPVLSVQNIVCSGTGTGYTVTFSSNAPVTTNNGTVIGNTVTVSSGNATLTSTTSCGEVTSIVVTAPSCPVPAQCTQVASLSIGNALCTGTGTYTVS
ncbi:MAG: Ig-like domain-containing protein, partial [Leadbetterella sp.]|nr:Ig-like domain-containing protein [Leadbetterella sp.]